MVMKDPHVRKKDEKQRIFVPLVSNIQRYSLQDGPGLRTTVFLKGCPLRCPWCHNPETQNVRAEINLDTAKCTACGKCITVCSSGATYMDKAWNDDLRFERTKCTGCGECVKACLPGARELIGTKMSIDEIIKEAVADRPFFANSGGGVTISGGEPLFFPEFMFDLCKRLSWEEAVHVTVDTSAFCQWRHLDELTKYINLFLVDIKTMDPRKHKEVVRGDLNVVLRNTENLLRSGAEMRIRIAVIPGFNNTREDFEAYAVFLNNLPGKLKAVDILPFHSYAEKKYALLGRLDSYEYRNVDSLFGNDVANLIKILVPVARKRKFELTIGGLTGAAARGANTA
jgi:pyruvate formate lyase activating enzyme